MNFYWKWMLESRANRVNSKWKISKLRKKNIKMEMFWRKKKEHENRERERENIMCTIENDQLHQQKISIIINIGVL